MKSIKTALLCAALAFSTSVLAESKTTQCVSTTSGTSHTAVMDGTSVTIQNEDFTFAETHTLKTGRDLFLFVNATQTHVLGMTLDKDNNMIYLISDTQQKTLDEGVCKSK